MKSIIFGFLITCGALNAQEGLIEYEKITVGKTGRFATIEEALEYKSSGIHILLDSGVFINDAGYWLQGNHVILEGNGASEIQCRKYYENVLWLNGSDITVRNLKLRHFKPGTIDSQNCSGRVIGLDNCTNVLIEHCDINGCGLAGIHDNLGNSDILVRNNYIHNNSYAAFTNIEGSFWMEETNEIPGFTFVNNRIENNGPDRVFEISAADLTRIDELPDSIRTALERSFQIWENDFFKPLLIHQEIEMNCADCPAIALEVVLVFDHEGTFLDALITGNHIQCIDTIIKEELKKAMIESIKELEFPAGILDKNVYFWAGYVLPC